MREKLAELLTQKNRKIRRRLEGGGGGYEKPKKRINLRCIITSNTQPKPNSTDEPLDGNGYQLSLNENTGLELSCVTSSAASWKRDAGRFRFDICRMDSTLLKGKNTKF